MASGFLNSSGTDLDNVFFVNNENGGAIGFLTSTGQDLGNRYNPRSTLGYNVGYKNSAGTDLGYLRGALTAPIITSHWISNHWWESDKAGCAAAYDCGGGHRARGDFGYLTVNGACSTGGGNILWDILIDYWHTEDGYKHHVTWNFALNTTSIPAKPSCPQSTPEADGKITADARVMGSANKQLVTGSSGGESRSLTFAYYVSIQDGRWGNGNGDQYFRIYQRFRNSLGSTDWVYNDVQIGHGGN